MYIYFFFGRERTTDLSTLPVRNDKYNIIVHPVRSRPVCISEVEYNKIIRTQ